jgi:hypothetical protein
MNQALGKSGQMPAFSPKSKIAVSQLEVLKQPHLAERGAFPKAEVLGKLQDHAENGEYDGRLPD